MSTGVLRAVILSMSKHEVISGGLPDGRTRQTGVDDGLWNEHNRHVLCGDGSDIGLSEYTFQAVVKCSVDIARRRTRKEGGFYEVEGNLD